MIEEFREAGSNSERGTKFENLMVDYFHLAPTLAVEYDEVQTWPQWDYREGTHDTGIDLVARNKLTASGPPSSARSTTPSISSRRPISTRSPPPLASPGTG